MWVIAVPLAIVAVLVVHGLVTDVRMRRLRKRIPPMTSADQRRLEVIGSPGARARRRNPRIQLLGGPLLLDMLRFRRRR